MASATAVKEAVKETLLGTDEPAQPSSQSKARFTSAAVKDADSGELYMGPEEFINAIAPQNEDFVSAHIALFPRFRNPGARRERRMSLAPDESHKTNCNI